MILEKLSTVFYRLELCPPVLNSGKSWTQRFYMYSRESNFVAIPIAESQINDLHFKSPDQIGSIAESLIKLLWYRPLTLFHAAVYGMRTVGHKGLKAQTKLGFLDLCRLKRIPLPTAVGNRRSSLHLYGHVNC